MEDLNRKAAQEDEKMAPLEGSKLKQCIYLNNLMEISMNVDELSIE